MAIDIGRRQFISAIGGATVAWSLAARAQPAMPVIGFLSSLSSSYIASRMPPFRQGLNESGYVEGQNVAIEYRLAEGQYDRLPGLAAELVARKVVVIVAAGGTDPAKAAKTATATIPIVFISAADAVTAGIVTSLNRPGGNVTGVNLLGSPLETKRLGLLNEIVPGAASIGVLVNPGFPGAELEARELPEAASAINRQINIVRASTAAEIDTAFTTLAHQQAGSVLIAQDTFFVSRRDRQTGVYVGKVLRGIKPADLPVIQPTKFELHQPQDRQSAWSYYSA